MNLYFHLCISIFCAILIYVYIVCYYEWKIKPPPDPLVLAIGILSARENFILREAVRATWLKKYSHHKNSTFKHWFIIGNDDCVLPPEYRLNKYGCDKWNINISDISSDFYTSYESQKENCTLKNDFRQGFSFLVNHPVVVKRLGILFNLLVPSIETKVALLNIQTKEIIIQTSILKNSSYFANGYLYEDVETVLLPKHFEGMVLVEGYLLHETCSSAIWNNGGGVITFNRIYSTPSHIETIEFDENIYSAVSIQFFVPDLNDLKDIVSQEEKITNDWITHLKSINDGILQETSEKKDILLVNVTDTYRNLPMKLVQFYQWIDQNYEFSYLMKTDDDTVVDIDNLITHMKSQSAFKPGGAWIWSWFRKEWPVNYVGKWADYDYRSSIYPSFPCGATYVMSHEIVHWLSLNANYLFPYQGEDVSMGIWLSAIKPNFIDDDLFECDSTCSMKSYNRAQLSAEQIREVWSTYEKCQNLCSCN